MLRLNPLHADEPWRGHSWSTRCTSGSMLRRAGGRGVTEDHKSHQEARNKKDFSRKQTIILPVPPPLWSPLWLLLQPCLWAGCPLPLQKGLVLIIRRVTHKLLLPGNVHNLLTLTCAVYYISLFHLLLPHLFILLPGISPGLAWFSHFLFLFPLLPISLSCFAAFYPKSWDKFLSSFVMKFFCDILQRKKVLCPNE